MTPILFILLSNGLCILLCLAAGPLWALFCALGFGALAGLMIHSKKRTPDSPDPQETGETPSPSNPSEERLRHVLTLLRDLEKVGIELTGATTSLAATAREQEASIAEQAAAATEILATSQQINSTSRELLATMGTVAANASTTAGSAQSGHDLLTNMQEKMDHVLDASGVISSRLANLNQRANRIGSIAVTIAKVADQTSLLSLNAAIEAEKAGDMGRGFGVVAGEIQRLADQTAVATLDIEHMIREMLTAVSSSVMGMEKFTEEVRQSTETAHTVVAALGEIMDQVQSMGQHFEQVNVGMLGQAQGAEQITDSMKQLSEATLHTAQSTRQFNQVIEGIRRATEQLARTVVKGRDAESDLASQ